MASYGRFAASSLAGRSTGAALGSRLAAGTTLSPAKTTTTTATTTTTTTTTTTATNTPESLAQRSLFVNVKPPPASLSERRSVLRVLERYGKTDMFKKMADNGSFIVIASTAAMASTLVERSPMQYEFLSETLQAAQPWGQPRVATLVQPIETTAAAVSASREGATAGATAGMDAGADALRRRRRQTDHLAHRSFVLSVFPSQDYHHRAMIRNSPLHGPWPKDGASTLAGGHADGYKNTFVYNALKAVVPESASSEALCDWRPRGSIGGGGGSSSSRNSASSGDNGGGGSPSAEDRQAALPSLDATLARIRERRARRAQASKSVLSSLLGKNGSDSSNGGSNKLEDGGRPAKGSEEAEDEPNR